MKEENQILLKIIQILLKIIKALSWAYGLFISIYGLCLSIKWLQDFMNLCPSLLIFDI
jgi:hypothetical protein